MRNGSEHRIRNGFAAAGACASEETPGIRAEAPSTASPPRNSRLPKEFNRPLPLSTIDPSFGNCPDMTSLLLFATASEVTTGNFSPSQIVGHRIIVPTPTGNPSQGSIQVVQNKSTLLQESVRALWKLGWALPRGKVVVSGAGQA